ncbi:MAG: efflux transporter outer membrane subunit [Rhodocyclaceae bacterium]|nr:efflux transporter outer membrane subunit [Rhodocyclaceae bacterium]
MHRPTSTLRTALLALTAATLSACTTLAPDYQRPEAPVPTTWHGAPPAASGVAGEQPWHEVFMDPRLRQVIAQALGHNRDLRIAALNIERARARYRIQRAELLPTVDGTASSTARRVPGDLSGSGEAVVSRQHALSVGITAWELDLFGRVRSLREQALQTYLATEEAARAAQVSLVAEVASAWLTLAADRSLLALAQDTLVAQQQTLDITRRSVELGAASRLAVSQLETTVARARADVARQRAQVAKDHNALDLLAGAPVGDELLPASLDDTGTMALAAVPEGVSSELLVRRPDVMQAERDLQAANANIGAARAAFFPTISLTASAGTASASLDGLFEAGQRTWSVIPSVSVPIFNAGALAASLDVAELQRDINVAAYERAIQSAFREVADALADRSTIAERVAAGEALVAAAREGFTLSEARTRNGVDSYLSLLDAQRTLYSAEQELIATRLAETSSRVTLYKVLGGGWQ